VPLSRATAVTSGTQNIEEIAISPDGVWLYYDSDRNGNGDIWRVPLKGGQPEQLTTDPAGDFAPSISPDGKEIAFHSLRNGSTNRDIFVMPAAGGATKQVSTSLGDDQNPAWSPDGHDLVWAGPSIQDSGILIARRRDDGTWAQPTRYRTSAGASLPVWTPGGRAVSYFSSLGLQRLDVATGEETLLNGFVGSGQVFAWSGDGRTVYGAAVDSLGRTILYSLDLPGGKPRTLAYADHPLLQVYRFGFAVQDGRMYLPLVEPKLDVWVAEVGVR
jgi:Tol biopolymer transport system component